MAQNKRTKTVVQALDTDSLLAGTLLEAESHSGADDNMEIDYSDEDSQPKESLGNDDREEEDEIDDEEVVVIPSPPPTVTKKQKQLKNKSKESSIGVSQ
jgi:hypothetical protein